MYCNNCGKHGHTYKQCNLPVLSYGIISFFRENDITKILMIQRKHSLCYIEFLRGKYNPVNVTYVKHLLKNCSIEELNNLDTKSFDELWKDLWTHKDYINSRIKNEYSRGKNNFCKISENKFLNKLISQISDHYSCPEWEFPKGRRNKNEYNKACAIREFKEETGIHENFSIIDNLQPIVEEYLGCNRVKYKHIYYLSLYNGKLKLHTIDPDIPEQFTEISKVQWFTQKEALNIVRDTNTRKKDIIRKVFKMLESYNSDYILF